MPRFQVIGKHYETGKKHNRIYIADDEIQAEKLGWDDGLIVEKTIILTDEDKADRPSLLSEIITVRNNRQLIFVKG